jgi:hypothetical protein
MLDAALRNHRLQMLAHFVRNTRLVEANLGIALVSQLAENARFYAKNAAGKTRSSAVFGKNGRLRNAGVR